MEKKVKRKSSKRASKKNSDWIFFAQLGAASAIVVIVAALSIKYSPYSSSKDSTVLKPGECYTLEYEYSFKVISKTETGFIVDKAIVGSDSKHAIDFIDSSEIIRPSFKVSLEKDSTCNIFNRAVKDAEITITCRNVTHSFERYIECLKELKYGN